MQAAASKPLVSHDTARRKGNTAHLLAADFPASNLRVKSSLFPFRKLCLFPFLLYLHLLAGLRPHALPLFKVLLDNPVCRLYLAARSPHHGERCVALTPTQLYLPRGSSSLTNMVWCCLLLDSRRKSLSVSLSLSAACASVSTILHMLHPSPLNSMSRAFSESPQRFVLLNALSFSATLGICLPHPLILQSQLLMEQFLPHLLDCFFVCHPGPLSAPGGAGGGCNA